MTNFYKSFTVLLLVITFWGLSTSEVFSQGWKRYRKEVFISLGASNVLGDLGGANNIGTNGILDFDFPSIRPAMNFGYVYRLTQRIDFKASFTWGEISGNDKYTFEIYRHHRNLSFRSILLQAQGTLEWFILREREGHKYDIQGVKGWQNIRISAYMFTGFSMFYFNPKAQYNAPGVGDHKWYALRPLSTEGEGLIPTRPKYSLIQPSIPVGIGFKYAVTKDLSIGIEYALYKTFTDYLDDVSTTYFDTEYLLIKKGPKAVYFSNPSLPNYGGITWNTTAPGQQRGDPREKDSYMLAFITLYYRLPGGRFVIPLF